MNSNKNKLIWIAFFLAFGAISCWATAESLHLLLPSFWVGFCWIITIGFFIIASLGTTLIMDSLNQNIYCEKRRLKFIGGIIIMLFFWLICSMPTNTHTFFYRNLADKEVTTDINTTKNYLAQIMNDQLMQEKYRMICINLDKDVDARLKDLEAEIDNDGNPGFGPNANKILKGFASILDVPSVEPLSLGTNSLSKTGRQKLKDSYRKKIYALRDARKQNMKSAFISPQQAMKDAKLAYDNLGLVLSALNGGAYSLHDAIDIQEISTKITEGYVVVKQYKDMVTFVNSQDQARYTQDKLINRIERLLSVFDVWSDLFAGKQQTGKFVFWIIISVLVDVAAFVFFDMAFKKEN